MKHLLFKKSNGHIFSFLLIITTTSMVIPDENPENFIPEIPAVFINPVTDMNNSFPPPNNPPASGDSNPCHRAHQALFNERGTIIAEEDDAIQVIIPNAVYGISDATGKHRNTFWVKKNEILKLSELPTECTQAIPSDKYGAQPTIVLTWPWKNFSIGTRFTRLPESDTFTHYAVKVIDYEHKTIHTDFIPRLHGLQEIPNRPKKDLRDLFVGLIYDLLDRTSQTDPENVISYVWGGSSFIYPSKIDDFSLIDGAWQRPKKNNWYSGYDCSELPLRIAQIVGIDFKWKTSAAMYKKLPCLTEHDVLQNGDIIWIQGHVMIVGNIEKNELIEARGYSSGWGCVHKIQLQDYFDGITTYADLLQR